MALTKESNVIQTILQKNQYKNLKSNDLKTFDQLYFLLESPLFQQILHIQDSLQTLNEKSLCGKQLSTDSFDIDSKTGDLILYNDLYSNSPEFEGSNFNKSNGIKIAPEPDNKHNSQENQATFQTRSISPNVQCLTTVNLNKKRNEGFGIAVKKINSRFFVESIDKRSTAFKNGGIHENDEIIAINGQKINCELTSKKLQENIDKNNDKITLQIVRSDLCGANLDPSNSPVEERHSPKRLQTFTPISKKKEITNNMPDNTYLDDGIYDVVLTKNGQGLGITIAGYADYDDKAKILINGVTKGSVADLVGKINVGDEILMVDGKSLEDYSNAEAVQLLKTTGNTVRLRMFSNQQHGRHSSPQILTQPLSTEYQLLISQQQSNQNIFNNNGLKSLDAVETGLSQKSFENSKPSIEPDNITHMQQRQTVESLKLKQQQRNQAEYFNLNQLNIEDEEELANYKLVSNYWKTLIPSNYDVIFAKISRFEEGGNLGISLEGKLSEENDLHPSTHHHFVHAILPDGPVGLDKTIQSGDEILQVNEVAIMGLPHMQVVSILKELPKDIVFVCGRLRTHNQAKFTPVIPKRTSSMHSVRSDNLERNDVIVLNDVSSVSPATHISDFRLNNQTEFVDDYRNSTDQNGGDRIVLNSLDGPSTRYSYISLVGISEPVDVYNNVANNGKNVEQDYGIKLNNQNTPLLGVYRNVTNNGMDMQQYNNIKLNDQSKPVDVYRNVANNGKEVDLNYGIQLNDQSKPADVYRNVDNEVKSVEQYSNIISNNRNDDQKNAKNVTGIREIKIEERKITVNNPNETPVKKNSAAYTSLTSDVEIKKKKVPTATLR